MSDDNVVSMAEKAQDAKYETPVQCLEKVIKEIEKGAWSGKPKILVLVLDDTDAQYQTNFFQNGMKMSECLTLCEVSKTAFLYQMKYIERPTEEG